MTPQRAQKILKEYGTHFTFEETEKTIAFLQKLSKMTLEHYLT